jgi:hypothetical protein
MAAMPTVPRLQLATVIESTSIWPEPGATKKWRRPSPNRLSVAHTENIGHKIGAVKNHRGMEKL